jgi:hypothetical protein
LETIIDELEGELDHLRGEYNGLFLLFFCVNFEQRKNQLILPASLHYLEFLHRPVNIRINSIEFLVKSPPTDEKSATKRVLKGISFLSLDFGRLSAENLELRNALKGSQLEVRQLHERCGRKIQVCSLSVFVRFSRHFKLQICLYSFVKSAYENINFIVHKRSNLC